MPSKPTGRPTGRPGRTPKEVLDKALLMLQDGASYREVAYTFDIPRSTLRGKFPGYGWTEQQGRSFIGFIAASPKRQALYDELEMPGKRRV